ncbi:MAG: rhomboid family intramembrane serine protease [Bernardetiaceae bacterium]|nr:rhomboid family intramembrane serine protease [Bernardetiaceae bacterium]
MPKHTTKIWIPIAIVLFFTSIAWLTLSYEQLLSTRLSVWVGYPRSWSGLAGIVLSPFLHGDWLHLLSNTFSFWVLMLGLRFLYPLMTWQVLLQLYLLSGLGTFMIGRFAHHIGASGVVYGLASFLFFSGVFRKDFQSAAIALVTIFLYGGMLAGVLPTAEVTANNISWEAHLSGLIAGMLTAFQFKDEPSGWENYDTGKKTYIRLAEQLYKEEGIKTLENEYFKYEYKPSKKPEEDKDTFEYR